MMRVMMNFDGADISLAIPPQELVVDTMSRCFGRHPMLKDHGFDAQTFKLSKKNGCRICLDTTWEMNSIVDGAVVFGEIYFPMSLQIIMDWDDRRRIMHECNALEQFNFVIEDLLGLGSFQNLCQEDLRFFIRGKELEKDDIYIDLQTLFGIEFPDEYGLYEMYVRIRAHAGGKRKAISISELRELPNDPPSIKKAFGITAFVSKAWLNSLSSTELTEYHNALKNAKGMPHQVETTLNKIKEYAELKVGEVFDTQT